MYYDENYVNELKDSYDGYIDSLKWEHEKEKRAIINIINNSVKLERDKFAEWQDRKDCLTHTESIEFMEYLLRQVFKKLDRALQKDCNF